MFHSRPSLQAMVLLSRLSLHRAPYQPVSKIQLKNYARKTLCYQNPFRQMVRNHQVILSFCLLRPILQHRIFVPNLIHCWHGLRILEGPHQHRCPLGRLVLRKQILACTMFKFLPRKNPHRHLKSRQQASICERCSMIPHPASQLPWCPREHANRSSYMDLCSPSKTGLRIFSGGIPKWEKQTLSACFFEKAAIQGQGMTLALVQYLM